MLLVSLNKLTFIHRICFSRFNGASFKFEPSSKFAHDWVSLGSFHNFPFVTGGYHSTNGLKTEILEYGTWIQVEDYPFSNGDR